MRVDLIGREDVRRLLPMGDCIDAVEQAMVALRRGKVSLPPRWIGPIADGSAYFGVMPGSSLEPEVYGAKVISQHPDNPAHGRPAIQGFVCLFDHHTGEPLALVDGTEVTGIRTAAASALATRELARPDARTLGLFGTGLQAVTHLEAIRCVRDIEDVVVWARDRAKAETFASEQSESMGLPVRAGTQQEAAACDVICTVTASPEPVLSGADVRDGAHVNLVGAHTRQTRESDSALMARASIWCDLMESARNEGGDITLAIEDGALDWDAVVGEIAQVLLGEVAGRSSMSQVTVYESLGIVAQDLGPAYLVWQRWKAEQEEA